jgi:hypothetical protein
MQKSVLRLKTPFGKKYDDCEFTSVQIVKGNRTWRAFRVGEKYYFATGLANSSGMESWARIEPEEILID